MTSSTRATSTTSRPSSARTRRTPRASRAMSLTLRTTTSRTCGRAPGRAAVRVSPARRLPACLWLHVSLSRHTGAWLSVRLPALSARACRVGRIARRATARACALGTAPRLASRAVQVRRAS
jgi:hypothetical protein